MSFCDTCAKQGIVHYVPIGQICDLCRTKNGYSFNDKKFNGFSFNHPQRNSMLKDLALHQQPDVFYELRKKKMNHAKNFMNKPKHHVGNYYSENRHPAKHQNDKFTQTLLKNKNGNDNCSSTKQISEKMYDYIIKHDLGPFDCIVPVPNHSNSKQNVAGVSLADELSKLLNVECLSNTLEKTLNIKAREIKRPLKEPFWNNNDLYVLSKNSQIKNKQILLVDDIITYGYTITQCIYQLTQENPKDITVLCAGMTVSKWL